MTLRRFLFLFILCGIFFLTSCDKKGVFESYSPIPGDKWQKDSIFTYTIPIKESSRSYNMYVNLRNSVDYSYSNIWLFLTITPPKGQTVGDTVEFVLADPSGKWFGNGYGKLRDNKLLYRRNVYFQAPGDYTFTVQHGMRAETLEGIYNVGIRLEKAN
jgi:gliding motility-associated lipoprotein GldH